MKAAETDEEFIRRCRTLFGHRGFAQKDLVRLMALAGRTSPTPGNFLCDLAELRLENERLKLQVNAPELAGSMTKQEALALLDDIVTDAHCCWDTSGPLEADTEAKLETLKAVIRRDLKETVTSGPRVSDPDAMVDWVEQNLNPLDGDQTE